MMRYLFYHANSCMHTMMPLYCFISFHTILKLQNAQNKTVHSVDLPKYIRANSNDSHIVTAHTHISLNKWYLRLYTTWFICLVYFIDMYTKEEAYCSLVTFSPSWFCCFFFSCCWYNFWPRKPAPAARAPVSRVAPISPAMPLLRRSLTRFKCSSFA